MTARSYRAAVVERVVALLSQVRVLALVVGTWWCLGQEALAPTAVAKTLTIQMWPKAGLQVCVEMERHFAQPWRAPKAFLCFSTMDVAAWAPLDAALAPGTATQGLAARASMALSCPWLYEPTEPKPRSVDFYGSWALFDQPRSLHVAILSDTVPTTYWHPER